MQAKQARRKGKAGAVQLLQRAWVPLKYIISSLTGSGVDYALFYLFFFVLSFRRTPVFIASRFIGAAVNFSLNKFVVFRKKDTTPQSVLWDALQYALLWCAMAGGAVVLMHIYADKLGIMEMLAKLMSDVTMFFFGYVVQRHLIFGKRRD
ncbi:MAG: GtrA family protein [Eubacteriales bacterium]|nr:GtrA family protein [Eubacteriales bacterium]